MACFHCVVLISLCCGLFPLCCANCIVLRLVSTVLWTFHCVVARFHCVVEISLCCSLFPLCFANFVVLRLVLFYCVNFAVLRLVSLLLWKFRCTAACFHCVVLISLCCSLFPLCFANFVVLQLGLFCCVVEILLCCALLGHRTLKQVKAVKKEKKKRNPPQ